MVPDDSTWGSMVSPEFQELGHKALDSSSKDMGSIEVRSSMVVGIHSGPYHSLHNLHIHSLRSHSRHIHHMLYLQSKEGMFEMMRPYVIVSNLLTLAWFITLQYYRFKSTGRACSGDYLTATPKNFNTIYLGQQGEFILYYIIAHYFVYVV